MTIFFFWATTRGGVTLSWDRMVSSHMDDGMPGGALKGLRCACARARFPHALLFYTLLVYFDDD